MHDFPILVALALANFFGVFGLVQLAGPRFLRDAYRGWDYDQHLRFVTGVLDIAAAAMLAEPSLRGWGLALAGILLFGSVVTMLNNRQYRYAALVTVMMVALLPAVLAIPQENEIRFITALNMPVDAR